MILYTQDNVAFQIDDKDLAIVSMYEWRVAPLRYVWTPIGSRMVRLHNLLFGKASSSDLEWDHINNDRFDNRRENLRIVTRIVNRRNLSIAITNKSGVRGVHYEGVIKTRPWKATIADGKGSAIQLGRFATLEEAATARKEGEARYWGFRPGNLERFRVLVADPPWKYEDKLPGKRRGAERNYPCLTPEEIYRFPIPPLTNDAVLFLWRTATLQQAALDVVSAWGFTLKTEIIWLKKTSRGNRFFGMGRILRAEHEVCLVASREKSEPSNHSTRSTFVTDDIDFEGLSAVATGHSTKPERFYEIIESLFPPPYCELFARRLRPNWTCLGNELSI